MLKRNRLPEPTHFTRLKLNNDVHADNSALSPSLRVIVAVHDNRAAVLPFVHALRIAFAAHGELEVVDVRPEAERINSIGIRKYLERWNLLPEGAKRGDVTDAGLRVQKVVRSGNKKSLIKKRIKSHPHDLLVIGTEEKSTRAGLFSSSLAGYLAEYFRLATLLIPFGSRPFVDETSGDVALKRVLVPVKDVRFFECAMQQLEKLLAALPDVSLEVTGLHVGDTFPALPSVTHERIHWKTALFTGEVAHVIAAQADALCADLVIMATQGRDTLVRTLAGSKTEQLLGLVSCPVLSVAVPAK